MTLTVRIQSWISSFRFLMTFALDGRRTIGTCDAELLGE